MGMAIKDTRLDLRVTSDVKADVEKAAALSGQTVSAFVLSAVVRLASKVIRESEEIKLSARDRDRFLAALDRDEAKPNAALRRAAKRYKAATR
jgi:uncharacterized protein (DUF1778 family)